MDTSGLTGWRYLARRSEYQNIYIAATQSV
jgi:hypothetical protein